jgi:hypothetical protein
MSKEFEDMRDEGTDLTTVLMAEADELPLEIEVPDDVATMQQRITEASSGDLPYETREVNARKANEVGVPLSEKVDELSDRDILLSMNKYLFGITVLLGTLVVIGMTTMIMLSRLF